MNDRATQAIGPGEIRISILGAQAAPRTAVSLVPGPLPPRLNPSRASGLMYQVKSEIKRRVSKEKLVRKFNLKMFAEVIASLSAADAERVDLPSDEEELSGVEIVKA